MPLHFQLPEPEMPTDRPVEEVTREQQVLWVAGYHTTGLEPGSFYHHLIDAAFAADRTNLRRLSEAFPNLGLAMRRWYDGTLAHWYGVGGLGGPR